MNLKRYNLFIGDEYIDFEVNKEESSEGEWVYYPDLSELFTRIEWLEKELTNTNAKIIKARECLTK